MIGLHPFRPLVHAADDGDVSPYLSPPYDVVGAAEAERLRDRDAHNSVRLALPAASEPHERAGRRLREWLRDGVLERRPGSALHLYEQEYAHRGERRTRRGVFGALELAPLDGGAVLPHEETHRGPKRDRLSLMEATGAQLSPVFLVARDPDGEAREAVESAGTGSVLRRARTPDGQVHRLRELTDGGLVRSLRRSLTRRPLLVADGHHRYETALALRERRPEWPGTDRVLACVVGGRDPGLMMHPTHRALSRAPPGAGWAALLGDGFDVRRAPSVEGPEGADEAVRSNFSPGSMLVLPAGPGPPLRIAPRPGALADAGLEGEGGEVASLVFSRLVLRAACGTDEEEAAAGGLLSYHRYPGEALRAAGDGGAAFYLPPPTVEAVWEAAREGRRLPPKTTYFWPKLPTGLLYRDLTAPG